MYWDVNYLYVWAMGCNYLQDGGFKWLSKEEIKKFDIFLLKKIVKLDIF